MNIIDCVQGSDEWRLARTGKVTGSRVADIIAKSRTKGEPSASRQNYLAELIVERLTGQPGESGYRNAAMDWGTEHEPKARQMYELINDVAVAQVGMVLHPSIENAACSPDGVLLSGAAVAGLIEIKCPNTATHLETLLAGKIPAKYVTQMMWQMACTCAAWCDFVSYDPRLPPKMRISITRVHRDDTMVAELENAVQEFLRELDTQLYDLERRFG